MKGSVFARAKCLLLYCRSGFEKEAATEIIERSAACGVSGYVKARPDSAYVVFVFHHEGAGEILFQRISSDSLVFSRQWVFAMEPLAGLAAGDRISPLIESARVLSNGFSECFLETADTNPGKELSAFLKKFQSPFIRALTEAGLTDMHQGPRLHVFFLDSSEAYLGCSDSRQASPWPMGIPRLRFPPGAPSRSTLKLEEAFLTFLESPETALQPGMSAVDLGAAPGGWTFQLVRRHIRTIAVDNGDLDSELLDSGLVHHFRVDGFRFRPRNPVDWMVCDIVEQPSRIATLVADWMTGGWCRRAIFNLKLPMKKRYDEVERCREIILERAALSGTDLHLRFRQLYHDRAEVTGYVSV